ncbi:MAG: hypothetical protein A2114_02530 [Candidatus Vogelbacteria bacterium GWA1_51_14]|uniref:DUF916 domain-containing protein n=1 Tax=Candidatus Vogelbacteria bacterium GWA1_51_14 TaxID=1802435 RepID=A0A1G2QAZ4_9BACT|nr:MAG: hypothetical protein A2114_02530 [Candidatus Vogelbacteria bacterium GWA1_51_14]
MKNFFIAGLAIWLLAYPVWAQETRPSFSITPAKAEFTVLPGETTIGRLEITNNLGRTIRFSIGLEDVTAGDGVTEPIKLLGDDLGLYSLKPYVVPSAYSLTIPNGDTQTLNFELKVPVSAPAGTRHGAITVTAAAAGTGGARANSQLASLIFLRIPGETAALGQVTGFGLLNGPIVLGDEPQFFATFANDGNVYLNPYGLIILEPMMALPGREIVVSPNFVLPGGQRIIEAGERTLNWRLAGWYRAELKLNRGYNNLLDDRQVTVLIIPWWLAILAVIFGLALIWWLVLKLIKR